MNRLCATFLEGSSVILEFGESVRLLTNPGFQSGSETWADPSGRFFPVSGVIINAFPPFEHGLAEMLEKLPGEAAVAAPRGFALKRGIACAPACHELAVGQTTSLGAAKLTATPASPADGRWSAMIEAFGFSVFFAGETLFEPLLGALSKQFPKIDLALLPVGGPAFASSSRRKTMMSAQEAAGLCAVLSPGTAVPILWEADPTACAAFAAAARIFAPTTKVRVLKHGESVCLQLLR